MIGSVLGWHAHRRHCCLDLRSQPTCGPWWLAGQRSTRSAHPPSTPFCRRFLLAPGPADKPLQCKILRTGGGLLKGGPQYTLLVEQEGGRTGTFLLAARKRKGGPGGASYVLSVGAHAGLGLGARGQGLLGVQFVVIWVRAVTVRVTMH